MYVALLRAVNVGGRQQVAMSDLRRLLGELGFAGAQSLLQSGNLVFDGAGLKTAEIERLLEAEAEARLGLRANWFVRTASELNTIVALNPFPEPGSRDPSHLLVIFLKATPMSGDVEALRAAIKGPELVTAHDQQLYIVYPAGIGRSKLTNALIERSIGCRGTGRNWSTVLKLQALASRTAAPRRTDRE